MRLNNMLDVQGPKKLSKHPALRKVKMPKISVIVPVYNTAKYLDRCLDSVVCQTFTDIEILCVDDCSPDNSIEILQRYAERDARVKIFRHSENLGIGGARNTAIKQAQAPYLVHKKACGENRRLLLFWVG